MRTLEDISHRGRKPYWYKEETQCQKSGFSLYNPFVKAGVLDKFVDSFWRIQRLYGVNFEECLYAQYDRERFKNLLKSGQKIYEV